MSTETLEHLFNTLRQWPKEDQEALAEYASMLEARRSGIYRVSAEERAAISEGLADVKRGDAAEIDPSRGL